MKRDRFSRSNAISILCGLLFTLLAYHCAFAQTGSSSVRGTVVDQQGNVVAGATITLINTEKNFTRSQVVSDSGAYVFNTIPPGTYRIEAEAKGFKKALVESVNARVDTPLEVNVQLEVGNVSESVSVSAGETAPLNVGLTKQ